MSTLGQQELLPFTSIDNYRDPSDHTTALRLWNVITLGAAGSVSLTLATAFSSRVWETNELTDVGTGLGIAALGCAAITGIVIDKFEELTKDALLAEAEE